MRAGTIEEIACELTTVNFLCYDNPSQNIIFNRKGSFHNVWNATSFDIFKIRLAK